MTPQHSPRAEVSSSGGPTSEIWLSDGMLAVSREVPAPSETEAAELLGFMPFYVGHVGPWLMVDKRKQTITLMDGQQEVRKAMGAGFDGIAPGSYELAHKQRAALWYAPDSYFIERGLAVPEQGAKERFRRGALGEFALFIDKDTPIHSGPVWTKDVGGIQIPEGELSRIYYQLEVGAPIEVR